MKEIIQKKHHRVYAMDFLRIICALLIFMRHSITMFGVSYGATINSLAKDSTSIVMTLFFIISGFSIYYTYHQKNLGNINVKINFYIKRAISVLPVYYLVHFMWIIFMEDSLRTGLILTPMELLGIQTMYSTFFGILHNGGTWFVSCILFSYFIYPTVQELLKIMSQKVRFGVFLLILFVLMYSSFLINEFSLGTVYSNPLYRSLEFIVGVMIASLLVDKKTMMKREKANILGIATVVFSSIILILMMKYKPSFNGIPIYHYSLVPIMSLIMTGVYFMRSFYWENNKILQYLSSLTYFFFLIQLFVWKLSDSIMGILGVQGNKSKFVISFTLSVGISIIVSELYDKPIRKFIKSVLQKKANKKESLNGQGIL